MKNIILRKIVILEGILFWTGVVLSCIYKAGWWNILPLVAFVLFIVTIFLDSYEYKTKNIREL